MGQSAKRCARGLGFEDELDRQRRYEVGMPGIPGSLKVKYEIKDLVSEGAHGAVYLVSEYGTARRLALKAYRKDSRSYQLLDFNQNALKLRELKDCTLRHSSIASYHHFCESKDLFCTVVDYLEGGSVRTLLEQKLVVTEHIAAKTFSQMLGAIAYIHSRALVHRDLRLEQFMLTAARHGKVKLCDLMHIARPTHGHKVLDRGKPAAFLFAAPESLAHGEYSAMSDMWSAGCMLFELVYGHPPCTGEDKSLVRRIVDAEPPLRPMFTGASPPALSLLRRLLVRDPHERATATQAAVDPWFGQSAKISAQQARECEKRKAQVEEIITETEAAVEAKQVLMMQLIEEEKHGDKTEGGATARSQFSRSLTGTYSNMSSSTASPDEDFLDPEDPRPAGQGEDDLEDAAESEDWAVPGDRSDLESDPAVPPSGADSHSDTWAASQDDWLARLRGDWDEFDSEFFDEDRAASSLWSEAEFSDWTAEEGLKKQQDKEFDAWAGGRQKSRAGADQSDPSNAEGKTTVEPWGSSSSSGSSSATTQSRSGWGSSSGGGSRSQHSTQSSRASQALEVVARDRGAQQGWGTGGSSETSRSATSSEAPWEAPGSAATSTRSATTTTSSASSGSSKAESSLGSGGRPKGQQKDRRRAAGSSVQQRGSQGGPLAPIAEGQQLRVLVDVESKPDLLGDLTNRALMCRDSAPWEAQGAGDQGLRRDPSDRGMIVLSRRSGSSSSSRSSR